VVAVGAAAAWLGAATAGRQGGMWLSENRRAYVGALPAGRVGASGLDGGAGVGAVSPTGRAAAKAAAAAASSGPEISGRDERRGRIAAAVAGRGPAGAGEPARPRTARRPQGDGLRPRLVRRLPPRGDGARPRAVSGRTGRVESDRGTGLPSVAKMDGPEDRRNVKLAPLTGAGRTAAAPSWREGRDPLNWMASRRDLHAFMSGLRWGSSGGSSLPSHFRCIGMVGRDNARDAGIERSSLLDFTDSDSES
jgi:hypothetical protein